jgi:ubiquinone/menaquinone biosynthesis C-methylase UbiE
MPESEPKWEQMPPHEYVKGVEKPKELKKPKETWKLKVFDALRDYPIVSAIGETIAIPRAVQLVEDMKIANHLKENGIYSDIGSGLMHVAECVVREGYNKNVKTVPFDIKWTPAAEVTKRMEDEGIQDRVLPMKADATKQPIADNSLDGALLCYVLHHMPKDTQQETLDEIKRTLKDDGKLFFVEDVAETEEESKRVSRWDAKVNAERKDEPHYYRKIKEWIKFMDENGFELIDESEFEDEDEVEGTIRHKSYILQRKKETNN